MPYLKSWWSVTFLAGMNNGEPDVCNIFYMTFFNTIVVLIMNETNSFIKFVPLFGDWSWEIGVGEVWKFITLLVP
jgi:hypothetical protein